MADLHLDELTVVYPGLKSYSLSETIKVIPLGDRIRVLQVYGTPMPAPGPITNINGVGSSDLDGTYFKTTDYRLLAPVSGTLSHSNYQIQATGSTGEVNGLTVVLDASGRFSGTLLQ